MPNLITDDLGALLDMLPPEIRRPLSQQPDLSQLLEVIMDLGRAPEARFPGREFILRPEEVTEGDIDYVTARVSIFGADNRAGIERTLHRISAIRNRKGKVIGLTCRVGRAVFGTIKIIEDLIQTGKSVLLLGRPGVGKTTMLREVARVLADDLRKRVVIVDTSNEIAGDGDIPHPAIGRARRMQVTEPDRQHAVMIEAVENHMPEVIVIDEIGTELEALAARTIAERGVQLVGTAHGNTLENLTPRTGPAPGRGPRRRRAGRYAGGRGSSAAGHSENGARTKGAADLRTYCRNPGTRPRGGARRHRGGGGCHPPRQPA